jgi:hypothetical protein
VLLREGTDEREQTDNGRYVLIGEILNLSGTLQVLPVDLIDAVES